MHSEWFTPVTALIGLVGLLWSITAWRLSGPALRVHCLAYRDTMLIRVFNAGRTPESIEHIVVGGLKNGLGGHDISRQLNLPRRLEPGETCRWELNARADPLVGEWTQIRMGWESTWILTGSMRRWRAEIIPTHDDPSRAGWTLVPRIEGRTRYVPLAFGLPTILLASSPKASNLAGVLITALGIMVMLRAFWALTIARTFRRRTYERVALIVFVAVAIFEADRANQRPSATEIPTLDLITLLASMCVAILLATPGAVPILSKLGRHLVNRVGSPTSFNPIRTFLRLSDLAGRPARRPVQPVPVTMSDMDEIANDLHGTACSAGRCFEAAETVAQLHLRLPPEIGATQDDDPVVLAFPVCGRHSHLMRMGGEVIAFDAGT